MAARKLQQEMDRVFKRVAEGVTAFDFIYEKVQSSSNPSQKEKLEQDLKREIKKLQRLRDQIKTWLGSNDIKDKKPLIEQRKVIETEMERFKAVEREMKTKAYSKEGLTNTKQDPREREKQDTGEFLQSMIEELERQCETLETEQESVQNTMKKGRKDSAKAERISEIENTLERHRWHIDKMETMMRMIENDTLATESVMELKEDINYYVESNQEVDFAEDEEIYDELNLDEDDENLQEIEYKEESNSLEDLAADLYAAGIAAATQVPSTSVPPAAISNTPRKPAAATTLPTSAGSVTSATTLPTATIPTAPANMKPAAVPPKTEMKYASAAQASIPQGLSPLPPPPAVKVDSAAPVNAPTSTATTISTAPSSILVPQTGSTPATPAKAAPAAPWAAAAAAAEDLKKSASPSPAPTPPPALNNGPSTPNTSDVPVVGTTLTPDIPPAPQVSLPPGLQDLVSSFDAARKRIGNPPSITTISKLLSTSYMNCPDSSLADKPHYYHPESPFPTPGYYPQEPIQGLDDEEIVSRMDVDTLFYIFYYRQGTYQQYVAAKELKKRSWRFHKRFLTWFQRHEEPKNITNDYEQGTYRYFDFEGLWLQRRKSNFKFEYQYLEDDI